MPKYQFFTFPYNQTTDFTYLEMGTDSFQEEKENLLAQDFEVDGEPIYAKNAKEAVKTYQTGFTRVVEDYNKSLPVYALIHGLIELYRSLRKKIGAN